MMITLDMARTHCQQQGFLKMLQHKLCTCIANMLFYEVQGNNMGTRKGVL